MIAKYLWIIGSIVITLLAGTHLYFTFFTNKFSTRNTKLVNDMQSSSPILTKKVTMWNAWIGFNASHSMGGIFIGIINLYLVLRYFPILQTDHFFFIFNILTISFYVWLATKYWYKTPLSGLTITLACYATSCLLTIVVE